MTALDSGPVFTDFELWLEMRHLFRTNQTYGASPSAL